MKHPGQGGKSTRLQGFPVMSGCHESGSHTRDLGHPPPWIRGHLLPLSQCRLPGILGSRFSSQKDNLPLPIRLILGGSLCHLLPDSSLLGSPSSNHKKKTLLISSSQYTWGGTRHTIPVWSMRKLILFQWLGRLPRDWLCHPDQKTPLPQPVCSSGNRSTTP